MTIAIPTGRLGKQTLTLLFEKGISSERIDPQRKLIVTDDVTSYTYIFVKPSDVITYVNSGYADLGIVGSDLIQESNTYIYTLLDLKIGVCKMIIGSKKETDYKRLDVIKVATKFPNIATSYFDSIQKRCEIVYLNGSVELAPLLKLSDVIVDITETGTTLKENDLVIQETICDVSAHLICNPSSYVFNQEIITNIKDKLTRSL